MKIPHEDRIRGINDHNDKLIYVIMFEEGKFLRDRIQKLCSSFLEPM